MRRLQAPTVDFSTSLAETISGIGSGQVRQVHTDAFVDSDQVETEYVKAATAANLYALPKVDGKLDPVVYGNLRKSDLVKMYVQYFVPESKPARRIYEQIKVSAKGKCPLCGGVGQVRTLDHYLPKANFPLYAVLPANLVPCCRDCNSDKLNGFAAIKGEQTIHPYFDDDMFFNRKWISAKVIKTNPPVLEYYVEPPQDWEGGDQSRVVAHFRDYGLAAKFSVEAAADIPETIQTRKTTLAASTPGQFSRYLAEKSETLELPINNWRRVMFSALASDEWFCSQTFVAI